VNGAEAIHCEITEPTVNGGPKLLHGKPREQGCGVGAQASIGNRRAPLILRGNERGRLFLDFAGVPPSGGFFAKRRPAKAGTPTKRGIPKGDSNGKVDTKDLKRGVAKGAVSLLESRLQADFFAKRRPAKAGTATKRGIPKREPRGANATPLA